MPATDSLLDSMLSLDEERRQRLIASLSDEEALAILYDWRGVWSRPSQLPPEDEWEVWFIQTGRGWGKTRVGAETTRERVEQGLARRVALIGETAADVRDVMVEGESGLLSVCPPWFRPRYEPSKRKLTWPNGAEGHTYSADDPDQLRGPQHDWAWGDEIAKWRYGVEAWANLMFGLRLGPDPRAMATSTPRPVQLVRDLILDPHCVITRGHIYENAPNLAPRRLEQLRRKYEGTRLGRQELLGELLDDTPGALWTRSQLDALRVEAPPALDRVAIAIDPAQSSGEDADETGIVAAGKGLCRCRGTAEVHGFVMRDVSGHYSPAQWARRAIWLFHDLEADRIVGEVNNGGDMVEHTIRTTDGGRHAPYKAVHASRGKRIRAEPIAGLYEQRKVHHVGAFPEMEDQMCNFTADGYDGSPDRLDALVWAFTELMLEPQPERGEVIA